MMRIYLLLGATGFALAACGTAGTVSQDPANGEPVEQIAEPTDGFDNESETD